MHTVTGTLTPASPAALRPSYEQVVDYLWAHCPELKARLDISEITLSAGWTGMPVNELTHHLDRLARGLYRIRLPLQGLHVQAVPQDLYEVVEGQILRRTYTLLGTRDGVSVDYLRATAENVGPVHRHAVTHDYVAYIFTVPGLSTPDDYGHGAVHLHPYELTSLLNDTYPVPVRRTAAELLNPDGLGGLGENLIYGREVTFTDMVTLERVDNPYWETRRTFIGHGRRIDGDGNLVHPERDPHLTSLSLTYESFMELRPLMGYPDPALFDTNGPLPEPITFPLTCHLQRVL